jgi:hypothetical protein
MEPAIDPYPQADEYNARFSYPVFKIKFNVIFPCMRMSPK